MCKTFSVPNWLFLKVSGTYIQLSSPALLQNCCLALTPYLGYSSNMKAHDQKNILCVFFCSPAPWTLITFTQFSFTLTPLPSLLPCKIFSCTPPFLTRRPPLPLGAAQLLSSLRLRMVCRQVRQGQGSKAVFSPLLNKRLLSTLCSLSTRGCLVYQCCHVRQ